MEPIRARVRRIPSEIKDFDVLTLEWHERQADMSVGPTGSGTFNFYCTTRKDIETFRDACDEWLLQGDE